MIHDDIPVPAPSSWAQRARLTEADLDAHIADRESAVSAAIRQHLSQPAMYRADAFTDLVCDQALEQPPVNDATECFPRWQRRPEPNALPTTAGPTVIPCSGIARWYLALRRFWRG